jgi:hypothetical protein
MPFLKSLAWIYEPLGSDLTINQIVDWWEKRRLAYNLFCLGVGIVSLLSYYFIWSSLGHLDPSEDVIEPLVLPLIVIGAPIAWNLLFLLGPVFHICVPKTSPKLCRKAGPLMLMIGFVFSFFILILPAADAGGGFIFLNHSRGH